MYLLLVTRSGMLRSAAIPSFEDSSTLTDTVEGFFNSAERGAHCGCERVGRRMRVSERLYGPSPSVQCVPRPPPPRLHGSGTLDAFLYPVLLYAPAAVERASVAQLCGRGSIGCCRQHS